MTKLLLEVVVSSGAGSCWNYAFSLNRTTPIENVIQNHVDYRTPRGQVIWPPKMAFLADFLQKMAEILGISRNGFLWSILASIFAEYMTFIQKWCLFYNFCKNGWFLVYFLQNGWNFSISMCSTKWDDIEHYFCTKSMAFLKKWRQFTISTKLAHFWALFLQKWLEV